MLYVGSRNKSAILMTTFAIWVLAPFVGLAFADALSKRWSKTTRAALHIGTLAIALVSVAIYADVAFRPRPKPASAFLIVPAASWLLIAVAFLSMRHMNSRAPK